MTIFFKKAERKNAKLRLALSGPTGAGKTESALRLATGIGGRIAVGDTENDSASLYADQYDFETVNITPPYTPEKFTSVIKAAEKSGFDILILDSITHEWSGVGGCLEMVDKLAPKFKGNTWAAWSEVTPKHRAFIDAILHSSIHIIVTLRSKMETIQEDMGNGKKKVKKVGMKSEQRDGIEYEFTTVLDLDAEHFALATKDRTRIFAEPLIITKETGFQLQQWLLSGSADVTIDGNQYLELESLMNQAGINIPNYCTKRQLNSLMDIQVQKFDETKNKLIEIIGINQRNARQVDTSLNQTHQSAANDHHQISQAQRDELQAFIDERGLDVKSVCEHLGIDALTQIEQNKFEAVKAEIDQLAKTGMSA